MLDKYVTCSSPFFSFTCKRIILKTIPSIWITQFLLTDIPLPDSLPSPSSVRHLVQHHLDIQGTPRRYFFELLSHFTTSELEKEKLQEFCSAEGQVSSCLQQHSWAFVKIREEAGKCPLLKCKIYLPFGLVALLKLCLVVRVEFHENFSPRTRVWLYSGHPKRSLRTGFVVVKPYCTYSWTWWGS